MFTLQSNSVMHRKKKKRRSFKNERLKEHLRDLGADSWWMLCRVCVCVLVSRWGNRNVIWMLWCLFWSSLFTISHTHSVMHRKKRKRLWKRKVGKELKERSVFICCRAHVLLKEWTLRLQGHCAIVEKCYLLQKTHTHSYTHTHPHCTHSLRAPCSHQ